MTFASHDCRSRFAADSPLYRLALVHHHRLRVRAWVRDVFGGAA